MNIKDIIIGLIQFHGTDRPVFVKLHTRNKDGDVIGTRKFTVEAVWSHNHSCAEIVLEESNELDA